MVLNVAYQVLIRGPRRISIDRPGLQIRRADISCWRDADALRGTLGPQAKKGSIVWGLSRGSFAFGKGFLYLEA